MATTTTPESIPPADPNPEPVAEPVIVEPVPEPIVVTDPVPELVTVANTIPEPVVEPTIIEPSPEPVAVVTDPILEPVIVAEPVPEPILEPVIVAEPVPEPILEPVIVIESGPEQIAVVTDPVPEPVIVAEPCPEQVAVVTEPVPEPVQEPVIVVESCPEPVATVTEPIPEPVAVVNEPVPEPVQEPVIVVEPCPEPVQEPVIDIEPASEPVAVVTESAPELVAEPIAVVTDPVSVPVVEPVPEQVFAADPVIVEINSETGATEQGVEIVEPLILDNSDINELVEQVGDLIDKVHEEISFDIKADEHEVVLEDTVEPAPEPVPEPAPEPVPELEPEIDIDKFADTDVYYINLDKSTHRRQLMEKEFAREKINARRFSAVNGHTIDKSDIARYQKAKILTDPRWGTLQKSPNISRLGIHLSHFGVWRHFQNASGKKYVLVFEDDVKLAKGFKSLFNDALSKAPNDWEMLFLSSAEDVYGTPVNRFFVSPQPGQRPRANHGLFCYVLKRTVIDKMIKLTIPVSFKLPHLDHVIREYYGGTLKAYYLAPQYRIAKHRDELISDRDGKPVNSIPTQMQKTVVPSSASGRQRSVPSLVGAKPVAKPPPRITAPPTVYGNWGAPTSAPAPRETYKPIKRI